MTQIRITKEYAAPNLPALVFKVGEVYDAILPIGGTYTSATIKRAYTNPNMYNIRTTESANLVTVEVPKANWEIFTSMPTYPPNNSGSQQVQTSKTETPKTDKSTKYIILGIAIIGFFSYLAMKGNKK